MSEGQAKNLELNVSYYNIWIYIIKIKPKNCIRTIKDAYIAIIRSSCRRIVSGGVIEPAKNISFRQ